MNEYSQACNLNKARRFSSNFSPILIHSIEGPCHGYPVNTFTVIDVNPLPRTTLSITLFHWWLLKKSLRRKEVPEPLRIKPSPMAEPDPWPKYEEMPVPTQWD